MREQAAVLEKHIIETLRKARVEKGLSYEALADLAGLHRTTISLIERGKAHPTLLVCMQLALALGLNPKDLLIQSR